MTSARTSFDFLEIKSIVLPYSVQNLYQRQHMFCSGIIIRTRSRKHLRVSCLQVSLELCQGWKKKTDRFNSSKKTCGVGSETLVNLPENCAIIVDYKQYMSWSRYL